MKLVHTEEYVEGFLRGALSAAAVRRIGFPWSEGLVKRTLTSLGGTLAAAEDALAYGWGANLAGGTRPVTQSPSSFESGPGSRKK